MNTSISTTRSAFLRYCEKQRNEKDLPEFDFDDLKQGLTDVLDHAEGKRPCRVTRLPEPISGMSPAQIKKIRSSFNVSQAVFAAILNVPTKTAISWESGSLRPSRAALRLLDVAKRHPEVLIEGTDG